MNKTNAGNNRDFKGKVRVITIITGVKSPYVLGKQHVEEHMSAPAMSELGVEFFK